MTLACHLENSAENEYIRRKGREIGAISLPFMQVSANTLVEFVEYIGKIEDKVNDDWQETSSNQSPICQQTDKMGTMVEEVRSRM